jgi:CPA1 family monovalent cation:H+ antiporter
MFGLELLVALGLAVLLGTLLAHRFGIAVPVVLLAAGLLLSLFPAFRGVGLPPEVVLLLFLPALLFWESLTTSLREIRRFLRGIILTGTLLVVVTAAAVAAVGHALGLSWGTAWLIGAAVAPTDATAVSALGRALPRRHMTTLRAESLINDGTALVLYGLALGFVTGEADIGPGHVLGLFVRSFAGGVAVGLAAGWLIFQARRRIRDPLLGNVATVLTPFVTYLLAEEIHASGVLAVVTCGLFMARVTPLAISAQTRQQATSFWSLTTFLLNGGLFVLVGMQLPAAVRGLSSGELGTAVLVTAAVYVTILLSRLGFLTVTIYAIRALDRRPQQRLLRTTARGRVVSMTAGFRGAVSLAVALAVPTTLPGGTDFPARDMIVFVTAGVVVASLVLQGLALPRVIRWARLPEDTSVGDELRVAGRTATQEALQQLPRLADTLGIDPDVLDEVRAQYEQHLAESFAEDEDGDRANSARRRDQHLGLRLAVIASKRKTVVRLRDEHVIDDTVLRRIQSQLDLEEVRLSGQPDLE